MSPMTREIPTIDAERRGVLGDEGRATVEVPPTRGLLVLLEEGGRRRCPGLLSLPAESDPSAVDSITI